MKYRIIENKYEVLKPFFQPQYKKFLFWRNISGVGDFIDSCYHVTEFSDFIGHSTISKHLAEKIISEFKDWLDADLEYTTIHEID